LIQNGANSLVGQAVMQLAKARGVKTISIIRNRFEKKIFFYYYISFNLSSFILLLGYLFLFSLFFTFNVYRPDFDVMVERLKGQGSYIVVSSDYSRTPQFKRLISDLPAPKLALNCTGGDFTVLSFLFSFLCFIKKKIIRFLNCIFLSCVNQ
jgi:trans-2-enoyl-CoA reductase